MRCAPVDGLMHSVRLWSAVQPCEPPDVPLEHKHAFAEQLVIGWCNLLLGIGAASWLALQNRCYLSLGKSGTGCRWLVSVPKLFTNASWDMWNTRCCKGWKPGNHRDVLAQEALDEAMEVEFERGPTDSFPAQSRHLFTECPVTDVLSSTVSALFSCLLSRTTRLVSIF